MNWLKWVTAAVLLLAAVGFIALSNINQYQTDGAVAFPALDKAVKVIRDEKGMAYLHAESLTDAIKAQGYITAQDRLFQMHLTRVLVRGQLAEFFGEAARQSDILQRTLGFYRAAQKHLSILDSDTLQLLQAYADGVNQYLGEAGDEHPLELGLAKLTPDRWTPTDTLAIMYYMGWGSAANLKAEIISVKLIEKLGYEKFLSIFPLAINPEDPTQVELTALMGQNGNPSDKLQAQGFGQDSLLSQFADAPNHLATGSNNWVMSAAKSPGGKPIVVNDPHLSTKMLPTIFYPIGLFTPDIRAVGANVPGIPGLMVGRNEYVATGVTNQYGDAQDLYIETLDPNNPAHYLQGDESIAFELIEDAIKIKDDKAPGGFKTEKLQIRLTNRGPVISNIQKGLESDKVITARWAPLETMRPSLGLDTLLTSKSIDDIKRRLANFTVVHLNFVFADIHGGYGWQTTGKLPIRSTGDGTVPQRITDGEDNWTGWIPYAEMPQSYNAAKGWVGTANHKTVTADYPYYYSTWFAPGNRYQRMTELLNTPGKKTVDEHWQFMRDELNVTARDISPILEQALLAKEETRALGEVLSSWNFRETTDSVATSVYQETYRNLAELVFKDDLGPELSAFFLGNNYFWQERFGLMLKQGESLWFDDITTDDQTETLTELIQQAGLATIADLSDRIGPDLNTWQWGKIHQIEFLNPLRRQGAGKGWLGGGSHPMAGSGDTLLRALYPLDKADNIVEYSATLRMVADLSDDDKVVAVSPGGISGRTFTPHFKDQIGAYMSGEKRYWWFSEAKIQQNAASTLYLRL